MGMMRRRFPHEIKAYKSNMFFGLTARQAICIVCALVLVVPSVLICSKLGVSTDTMGYIVMFEAIPFGAAGWINYNDMALEKFAEQVIRFYFGARRRKWQFENQETKIHNAVMNIEYERLCEERKEEIANEKLMAKENKKAEKLKRKEAKKKQGKVK